MATKDSTKKPRKPRKKKSDFATTAAAMAYMAGISDRAAYQAVSDGRVRKQKGVLLLKDAFEFAVKREMLGTETSLNEITDEEVQANKAALEKAKADLAETEVDIEKLNLVNRRELSGYLVNEMTIMKRELLALSRTIPSTCYGMERDEIVTELQRRLQKVYNERLDASEIDAFIESQIEVK